MNSWRTLGVLLAGAITATATAAAAEGSSRKTPLDPAYVEECGSCHVAFTPRALGASSWDAVMGNLADHFGVDASLETATAQRLLAYLREHARRKDTLSADGQPERRITRATWFVREHDEIDTAVWKRTAVKSASNCAACHTGAETGSYSERNIRIPH